MKKRIVAILLSAIILTTCLAGCTSPSDNGTASAGTVSTNTSKTDVDSGAKTDYPANMTQPGELPIANEKVTFTAFMPVKDIALDLSPESNAFSKWLLEQTNIEVEFTLVNETDAKEKLSLMVTGGELPEILFRSGFSLSEQQIYGTQGLILPLNDLIDKYCVNAKDMFEKYPTAKSMFTLGDGNIYDLPSVNECYHCCVTQKMWVYKPWLEQLGGKAPTTTDEFYEMLKKIKTTDLNGNGKVDEIPVAGSPKGWDSQIAGFLMQPFTYADVDAIYVDGGKVKASYNEEEWREGLRYLKKLYSEGLIAPESLIQDGQQYKQMGSTPEHILAFAPGGYQGTFSANSEDWGNWTTIAPLKGPTGRQSCAYNPYDSYYGSFSITNKCESPEIAMRLADFFLSEQATNNSYWGPEGKAWEYIKDSDLPSIDGAKAYWQPLIKDADIVPSEAWNQAIPTYRPSSLRLGTPINETSDLEVMLFNESKNNSYPYVQKAENIFPKGALAYDEAQATELAMYEQPITDFKNEMTAKFITGEKDIEKDWDSYVSDLDKAGLQKMLTVYQTAYDAKTK